VLYGNGIPICHIVQRLYEKSAMTFTIIFSLWIRLTNATAFGRDPQIKVHKLKEFIGDDGDISDFIGSYIDKFKTDVITRVKKIL
jgi:hypothetical protein